MRHLFIRAFALMAILSVCSISNSNLFAQGGTGGSGDFARSENPTGSGSSVGIWSDGSWITTAGASSAGPQAGDTIFIGDRNAVIPATGLPSFPGTVEVDVDNDDGFGGTLASRTVAEANLGNVSSNDTGILNINGGVDLFVTGDVNLNQGALNISSGNLDAGDIDVTGGTLDLSAGMISANSLTFNSANAIGNLAATVNVDVLNILNGADVDLSGGTVNADDINIENATVTIQDDDFTDNVSITMGGSLIFAQDPGDTTGLTLDTLDIAAGSTFQLSFDASTALFTDDADWVLQLTGDQQDTLRGFINSGRLVSISPNSDLAFGVFFDGSNTFLTAIPEPGFLGALCLMGGLATLRRRRS